MVKKNNPIVRKDHVAHGLSSRISAFRFWELSSVVGERALELIVNLAVMILVERKYGQSALGVFSYLLSFYHITARLAEFGLPQYVERETALHSENAEEQAKVLNDAFQAVLILSLLLGSFFFLSAGYDTAHTSVQEKMIAYFIMGLAIPLRNTNRLRMVSLHGRGRHAEAAKLQGKKRIVFLGTMLALLTARVPPSYLVVSFLLNEIYLALAGRKKLKLPPVRSAGAGLDRMKATLREGYRFIFTDDAIDLILYIDLMILGIFISDWNLGVYAEAAVLAKFFLLIPMSIRPIFLRRYCVYIAHAEDSQAALLARRVSANLFFIHSLVVLYLLLFYPEILNLFFRTRGEELLSFRIFEVFVPGMLLAATFVASEPLYEALGQISSLRRLMMTVIAANLVLNVYLIPFAGLFGAAFATMLSLLLHFLLFGRKLAQPFQLEKGFYLLAGSAVYVTFGILEKLDLGMATTLWLLPIFFPLLLYFIGFFNHSNRLAVRLSEGGVINGGTEEHNSV